MRMVQVLVTNYYVIAQKTSSLDAVLDQAELDIQTLDLQLVQHAVMIVVTNYPLFTGRYHVPPAIRRDPAVTKYRQAPHTPPDHATKREALFWWIEDPLLSEHHEYWHFAYPSMGIPVLLPNGVPSADMFTGKPREGELFIWMHKQMVAR
jgi:hypothetical protein